MHFLSIWIVPGKIKFFNSSREKALRCNFIECWKWEQRNRMLHQIKHLLWFSSHFILFFSNLLFCKAKQNFVLGISLFLWRFAFLFESSWLKEKPQSAAICSALIVQKMHFKANCFNNFLALIWHFLTILCEHTHVLSIWKMEAEKKYQRM